MFLVYVYINPWWYHLPLGYFTLYMCFHYCGSTLHSEAYACCTLSPTTGSYSVYFIYLSQIEVDCENEFNMHLSLVPLHGTLLLLILCKF